MVIQQFPSPNASVKLVTIERQPWYHNPLSFGQMQNGLGTDTLQLPPFLAIKNHSHFRRNKQP